MGVAVLHPQHSLKKSSSSKTSPPPPPNMKSPKLTRTHPKRTHSTRPDSTYTPKPQPNNLVTGQVKILKRGEQLAQTTPHQQPETIKEPFRSTEPVTEKVGGLYAGASMLLTSPPPSSVPLPVFITKKITAVNDATSDLRKILRLEFL